MNRVFLSVNAFIFHRKKTAYERKMYPIVNIQHSLYSCGVIFTCLRKYLLKKERLLNPNEKAISFTGNPG